MIKDVVFLISLTYIYTIQNDNDMKTKHTPGPWYIDWDTLNDYGPVIRKDCAPRNDGMELAQVFYFAKSMNTDIFAANANLMAASPIMFDALRAVENTLLDAISIDSTRNVHSPAALLGLVQNAIQKATS